MLETIVPDQIWFAEHPVRFGLMHLSSRMTVVKLDDDLLWLHSPIPLNQSLHAELAKKGKVGYVVAPNTHHHLYFAECMRAYPDAQGFVAPGLARKNPDLSGFPSLGDTAEPAWSKDLASVFIDGLPGINETVWFHRASGTLMVTDLLFCFGRSNGMLNTIAARLLGVYDRLGMSRTMKFFVKDKAAFRACVASILSWDVQRIILAHDQIIERDAKEKLHCAFSWIDG